MSEERKENSTSANKQKNKKPVYLSTFFNFKKDVEDKFEEVNSELEKAERKLFWRSLITFILIVVALVVMYINH